MYLPEEGEGDNMATQTVTATSKLIYKWFNDGDIYDNHYWLDSGVNDLSSYANWLYEYLPETRNILDRIKRVRSEGDYVDLLYELYLFVFDTELLQALEQLPKTGSVYNCDEPFEFKEHPVCPDCGEFCSSEEISAYGVCRYCHENEY